MSRHSRDGYRQVFVQCPFYRNYTSGVIRCEGIMEGTGMAISFADRRDQMRHMEVFCEDHYKNCEIYRMVMDARYEEDEGC